MKRKALTAIVAGALLFGGLWFLRYHRAATLPRIPLVGGGEFRVVQISYGDEDAHHLGGAPPQFLRLWNRLPSLVQRVIPPPVRGDGVLVPSANHTALSIYWAWIDPVTQKPVLGPSGDVIMTTDSGEQTNLGWPDPFDDRAGDSFRQIFVDEPPRNSFKLRFRVPVNDETVEFTIDNPAYTK